MVVTTAETSRFPLLPNPILSVVSLTPAPFVASVIPKYFIYHFD